MGEVRQHIHEVAYGLARQMSDELKGSCFGNSWEVGEFHCSDVHVG